MQTIKNVKTKEVAKPTLTNKYDFINNNLKDI